MQAGQQWALSSMPFRGEVIEVLEPLIVRCKTAEGREALKSAIAKLAEDTRYMVPTFVTFVNRQLKVCPLHNSLRTHSRADVPVPCSDELTCAYNDCPMSTGKDKSCYIAICVC